mgnify:CR=1 FL=1|jgi:hypothetical protein
MTPEQLFSFANLVALLAWVALILLPRVPVVTRLVTGLIIPSLLAVTYVALLAMNWGGPGGFGSLAGVAQLFDNRWMLLAGWIHYLAFDLLVGTWEARDARERGLAHLLLVPCLLLTFMFGPAGWLLYQGVRQLAPRPVN